MIALLRNIRLFRGLTSLVLFVAIWEIVAVYIINDKLFLAPFSEVILKTINMFFTGFIWKHLEISGIEFFVGFIIASFVGIGVGLIMGANRKIKDYLDPGVTALYTTPRVALTPLFILWFGLGINSKIALVFLSAVFPVIVNTYTGIEMVDKELLEVGQSFCANRKEKFLKILLPFAMPYIFAGIRLGLGRGLVGIVVGEMFASKAGIGFLIVDSGRIFDTAGLFAGVLIITISGLIMSELLKVLEVKIAPWRQIP